MTSEFDSLTDLEEVLLGGRRRYTKQDVARQAGVVVERSVRLWRALGFVDVADDAVVFTDDDVSALSLLVALVDQGVIDEGAETSLARSAGQALARLADWQARLVREAVENTGKAEATEADLVVAAEQLVPVMERLQSYIWRRHLVAAAGRLVPVPLGDPTSTRLVVGFADVVGFTRYSRSVDDVELAEFVDHFENAVSDTISARGGRVIKMIGDEVMFAADTPTQAADIALDLVRQAEADEHLPDLRLGLAYGDVLNRLGDVYGPVVNVAARLTSLARPNSVLVDRELFVALTDRTRYRLHRLRRASVRGYTRLESWALRPAD